MNEKQEDSKQGGSKPGLRRYLRLSLHTLQLKISGRGDTFIDFAKNISRSGIFIASVNPREPGSRFQVDPPAEAPEQDRTVYLRGGLATAILQKVPS
jgi:hypothetical protein